jgi:hypothetical protein
MSWIGQPGAKSGVLIRSVTGAALAGLMFGFDTFIAFIAFSQGAVIWVYISEIFPQRVRARGQSLGSATHWIMNAVISGVFHLVAARSKGAPSAVFAAVMVVQFLSSCWPFQRPRASLWRLCRLGCPILKFEIYARSTRKDRFNVA